jgi:chromate transporter
MTWPASGLTMTKSDLQTAANLKASDAQPPLLSYPSLFLRFLRFGAMAFGGPVAQIAMIRRELVDEERWISSDRFNKLLAVMQVLPGPEAHELCVHLGIRAKGRLGGLLAGLGFMLPGLVLMLALAWLYTRLPIQGTLLGAAFLGVQAAVIAVIVRAVHRIGEHILLDPWLWAAAIAAAAASLVGVSFWVVLPTAGATYALASTPRYALVAVVLAVAAGVALLMSAGAPAESVVAAAKEPAPTTAALFWAGLKGGLLTFGGAYTAIPFIRNDTVGRGWMTDAQFLDGLGLSGILPAPLVIFATFVGWISGGPAGALAMTAGMFLPAFAFSMLFYERLEAVVEHKRLQLVLAGVAAGVVGLIALTVVDLARTTFIRTPSLIASTLIFAVALGIMCRWKSKLATPTVLAMGAAVGAAAFR